MSPAKVRTRIARSGDERTNHEATAPPVVVLGYSWITHLRVWKTVFSYQSTYRRIFTGGSLVCLWVAGAPLIVGCCLSGRWNVKSVWFTNKWTYVIIQKGKGRVKTGKERKGGGSWTHAARNSQLLLPSRTLHNSLFYFRHARYTKFSTFISVTHSTYNSLLLFPARTLTRNFVLLFPSCTLHET